MICEFETSIRGIPCIIQVTDWEPYRPPILSGSPDNWCPAEGGHGDYLIMTRRGRPAKWLERHMTVSENEKLDLEVFEFMERPWR